MNTLERIEWTQYWVENSGRDKNRILLIGDSISVGYRSPVQERVLDTHYISAISTSKAIDNDNFIPEIRFLAAEENYTYDVIHFNNGLHGFHLDDAGYEAGYRKTIEFLRAEYPNARLILALSTPITAKGDTAVLDKDNDLVIRRNECVKKLGAEYGIEVEDLYTPVLGKAELRAADGYHYLPEGYQFIADVIKRTLG